MFVASLSFFAAACAVSTVEAAVLARTAAAGPQCSDVSTSVNVSTTVRQFPATFNRTTFDYTTVPGLPDRDISGAYQIAASYCEPGTVDSAYHDTLQILIHGITYTRTYWSGLGHPPDSYAPTSNSYIDYASDQGYPTLAIDRLCNGNSTHPSDSEACQTENQVAVLKTIVDAAKAGHYGGRPFTDVILVGHSYGSVLTEAFTRFFPSTVRTVVLTGFTGEIEQIVNEQAHAGGFAGKPANQVDPDRFGSLDSNYLLVAPEAAFIGNFYAGSYNHTVAEYNFNTSGPFNFYELATLSIGQIAADDYAGTVLVLNGELDAAVCGPPAGNGTCETGNTSLTDQVSGLYPNATKFTAHNTPNTGHVLNLHTSSTESFQVIFDELSQLEA